MATISSSIFLGDSSQVPVIPVLPSIPLPLWAVVLILLGCTATWMYYLKKNILKLKQEIFSLENPENSLYITGYLIKIQQSLENTLLSFLGVIPFILGILLGCFITTFYTDVVIRIIIGIIVDELNYLFG